MSSFSAFFCQSLKVPKQQKLVAGLRASGHHAFAFSSELEHLRSAKIIAAGETIRCWTEKQLSDKEIERLRSICESLSSVQHMSFESAEVEKLRISKSLLETEVECYKSMLHDLKINVHKFTFV